MHAAFQPDGRSPKQVNGSTLTSQLKPASDNGQNSGAYPSQAKGKKRERVDNIADPIKRERASRNEDGEFLQFKTESKLKCEIARITEKGGVVDFVGVEKLVQLMGTERMERKMDLASRSILAGVMAATDRVDCLTSFIHLRGLPILDEWLQDIHKGKIGDPNGKDSEKTVDEFLLVLLRALDKLPVNLQALQMCNIGRSVNHLRSHKNLEIQKKARSLVDKWKKRVEAEMMSSDTRSSKPRLLDAAHGGSRLPTPSGSDLAMKSSVPQNTSSKTTSVRSSHVESTTPKSATSSPGPMKPASSSPPSCKEGQPSNSVGGTPEVPLSREDRSSSSNQSHNCSQSLSGKDDAKSLNGGSVIAHKSSSCSTRSRKVSNFPASVIGSQKEASSGRSPSGHTTTGMEKIFQPVLSSSERVLEGPINEGSSHKLIVKIPNRVGSPAKGVGGASLEDATYTSKQISSPGLADRHELFDRTVKERSNVHQNAAADSNMGLLRNNGPKDVLSIKTEGVSHAVLDDENSMATEDSRGLIEDAPKNEFSSGKLHSSSFGPMNALIESCAKYSEATSSLSPGDDIGMNLLASVATGEISRSDIVSHDNSTEKSIHAVEGVCAGDDARSKFSPKENSMGVKRISCNDNEIEEKHISGEDVNILVDSSSMSLRSNGGPKREICDTPMKNSAPISAALPTSDGEVIGGEIKEENHGVTYCKTNADGISVCRSDRSNIMMSDGKIPNLSSHELKLTVDETEPYQSSHGDCKKVTTSQQILSSPSVKSELVERPDEKLQRTPSILESGIGVGDKLKDREPNEKDVEDGAATGELNSMDGSSSTSNDLKNEELIVEGNPGSVDHVALGKAESRGSKPANVQPDEAVECGAEVSSSSAAGTSDVRIKFDLNEGFSNDDGRDEEHLTFISSNAATGHVINSSQFSVNSIHNGPSASITVAAAAKGPFVPPEDLLKSKGELRWKGSAATSAFRPAEPRKVEIPFGSAISPCTDASSSKHSRVLLDFDLNVPDERLLEEMASRDSVLAVDSATNILNDRATLFNKTSGSVRACGSGGLDLDLNRTDDANDNGHCSGSNRDGDASILHVRSVAGLPSGDGRRNFDLNDGPGVDETVTGNDLLSINQPIKGSVPAQLSSGGLRMNVPGMGGYASWFPPGNTYSTVAVPSLLTDRGEQQFPVLPPNAQQRTFGPSGVHPFTPDIYRGSVLSSSPALSFPASHFQYPMFPFGTTFPLPSATFQAGGNSYADSASAPRMFAPPVNPQLLGPVASMTPQFPRGFMLGLPDNINDVGLENNRKWGRQGLDLNAGPGTLDNEGRLEMLSLPSVQHSLSNTAGNILKRREPEGGLENENFRFKQSSWQ